MPTVMNASGQGAASKPARYGPSSLASRHAPPAVERTMASFCMPESDRAHTRTVSPSPGGGPSSPSAAGRSTAKKTGRGSPPRTFSAPAASVPGRRATISC